MQMVMPMRVLGLMVWRLDSESITIKMVLVMRVGGLIICKKEMVRSIGPIMRYMRGNIKKGKRMEQEHLVGVMELNMLDNL